MNKQTSEDNKVQKEIKSISESGKFDCLSKLSLHTI